MGRSNLGAPYLGEIRDSYIGHNTITNFGRYTGGQGDGIAVVSNCDNITVEYNYVGDGSGAQFILDQNEPNDGYYPTNITVRYNEFESTANGGWPIILQVGEAVTAEIYGNLIKKTAIYDDGGGIWEMDPSGRDCSGQNIKIYNNTLYVGGGRGIDIDISNSNTTTVTNNIIYFNSIGNDQNALDIQYSGSTSHSYNLLYCSPSGGYYAREGSNYYYQADIATWEPTAVTSDPTFVTNFTDLHLQSGSPADGAGTNTLVPVYDYDGNTYNDPPAIGAYRK